MQLAAQRAMQGTAFSRATYFGDGPWDRRASEQLGYDFIAVGKAVPHRTLTMTCATRTRYWRGSRC